MAPGVTGRAKGDFGRSFNCAIHPTPRGRPLRGAKCILIPLGAPDLPLTQKGAKTAVFLCCVAKIDESVEIANCRCNNKQHFSNYGLGFHNLWFNNS